MGCGWGYGNYRNKNEREGPVFCLNVYLLNFWYYDFLFFWGILGWDPVRTTCILCEMMMRL